MKGMITSRLLGVCVLGPALLLGCRHARQDWSCGFCAGCPTGPAPAAPGPAASAPYLRPYAQANRPAATPYLSVAENSPYSRVPAHLTTQAPRPPTRQAPVAQAQA